jgi:hypothetical protein
MESWNREEPIMDEKLVIQLVISGDWVRKLTDRAGLRRGTHSLPDWVVQELRPAADGRESRPEIDSLADIPPELKRRIEDEAIQEAFHRLETPLRMLVYATQPGQEPRSIQECRDILDLWRHGLEQEVRLVPDAYTGAVISYQPALDCAYHINGRCESGDAVRISVPAWRVHGEVVVRGEAEPMVVADSLAVTPALPPAIGPERGHHAFDAVRSPAPPAPAPGLSPSVDPQSEHDAAPPSLLDRFSRVRPTAPGSRRAWGWLPAPGAVACALGVLLYSLILSPPGGGASAPLFGPATRAYAVATPRPRKAHPRLTYRGSRPLRPSRSTRTR